MIVYNKCDCAEGLVPFAAGAVCTSAVTGDGLDTLLARIDAALADRVRRVRALLPYDKLSLAAPMRENGTVLTEEYRADGVLLEGIVRAADAHVYDAYLL